MLPFEAIAVNAEILKKLDDEEERLKEANINPVNKEFAFLLGELYSFDLGLN